MAVKIPNDENIASGFILKQPLDSLGDVCVLHFDDAVRDLANWIPYAVNETYAEHTPHPEWSPRYPDRLGLSKPDFDITAFEQYLLTVSDPIRELYNLVIWISSFVTGKLRCELVLDEAKHYWERRYQAMKSELRLREQAGEHNQHFATVLDVLSDAVNAL